MKYLGQISKADKTRILGAVVVVLVGVIIYLTTRQVPQPGLPTAYSPQSAPETSNTNNPLPTTSNTGSTGPYQGNNSAPLNTSSWVSYVNPTEGFSIKYPLNWTSKIPANTTNTIQFGQINKTYFLGGVITYAVAVQIEPNPNSLSPYNLAVERNHTNGKITTLNINGESAAQLIDYIGTKTYLVRNKKLYTILTPDLGNQDPTRSVLAIYKTMVQTFRFTQ